MTKFCCIENCIAIAENSGTSVAAGLFWDLFLLFLSVVDVLVGCEEVHLLEAESEVEKDRPDLDL